MTEIHPPRWARCSRCRRYHLTDEACAVDALFETRHRDDVHARRAEEAEASATYERTEADRRAATRRLDLALAALGAPPVGRCRCPRWTPGGCCLDAHPMEVTPR